MTPLEIRAETATLRRRLKVVRDEMLRWAERTEGQLTRLEDMGDTLPEHFCREKLDRIGREIEEREGRG